MKVPGSKSLFEEPTDDTGTENKAVSEAGIESAMYERGVGPGPAEVFWCPCANDEEFQAFHRIDKGKRRDSKSPCPICGCGLDAISFG